MNCIDNRHCTCEIFYQGETWTGRRLSTKCPLHDVEAMVFIRDHPWIARWMGIK